MKQLKRGIIIVAILQVIFAQQTIQSSKLYSCIQNIKTPCSGTDTVCQVDYGTFGQCYVACASSTTSLPSYEECIQTCIKQCPNPLVQSFGSSILNCYSTNYSAITQGSILIFILLILVF
ncbi:transmembrane protein, putative (macronuclear) [Tetrahymena thermophila SB210]|uniref:Transmembrane protein, putative n=1 Tax=Tetrahymena thermophila (strain SB210) TaxID=312017 RepID=W7XIS9_TETTS|nr:transmembrane protein, putative [Tetrahymena thermophila SB210]EWS74881.1 transmembrane protein, putative [Tetrahymena thermophila SB210]|eukprot:XP_012652594.1 transmembrane protein, putative [Tetrahymena thermophila SB210]